MAPIQFTYDRETFPFPPSQTAEDFFVRPMQDSPPIPPQRAVYARTHETPGASLAREPADDWQEQEEEQTQEG